MLSLRTVLAAIVFGLLLLFPSGAAAQAPGPAALVEAFDAALNARNVEGVVALFAEDGAIKTQTGTYTGTAQIRAYIQQIVAQNFQFTLVGSRQVTGDTETHRARVTYDDLRRLGLGSLEAVAEVTVQGSKIKTFSVSLTPESLARLQAATGGAPNAGPRTGGGPGLDGAGWLGLGGLGAAGLGWVARRRATRQG